MAAAPSRQVRSRLLQQDVWGRLPLPVRPLFSRRLPPRDGKMCLPAGLPGGEVIALLTNALISNRVKQSVAGTRAVGSTSSNSAAERERDKPRPSQICLNKTSQSEETFHQLCVIIFIVT